MSKILDVNVTMDEYAFKVGVMQVLMWQMEKKIRVLEKRVDELDPPDTPEPPAPVDVGGGS